MRNSHGLSRRSFLRAAGVFGGAAALAACAPATPQVVEKVVKETVVVAPEAAEKAPVTLTHWQHHAASYVQAVESFKARFEDLYPHVSIDFQSIPWAEFWGKLASAIAAGKGSAPDVFMIPMGLIDEYVLGGSLVPVDENIITTAEIEESYWDWTIARGKKDGVYYGLPLNVQTLLIYRNNVIHEEAGLDPTEPFIDHADFYEKAMLMMKKTNGETDQIGCNTNYYCAWQTTLYQQFLQREKDGTHWIDPATNRLVWHDYPEIFQAFEWFCKLSADADDSAFMKGQNRFALGKAGMEIGHPVSRGTLRITAPDLEYTISPFPPRSAGQDLYTAGSHWMWVVGKWAPDYHTAWQWVHFCTNKPAQVTWVDVAGDLPSHKDLADEPRFRQDANAVVVMDSIKYASPWEWVGWAEWCKEFTDARDRVVIGGEATEQSFNTMVENLNKVIDTHTPKA
ncbi:MAG: extracellular solute-binding protein [Anaerolineae bacterium]|nr:extracellular solute-binding protein [Anaerolineae bacterium]